MKQTGEKLKSARLSKGLSLHEISLAIKVSSKILQGIEEGDLEHLPAKTFLRGFVQSYANYLKLDTDDILKTFYEEMGSTKPKEQSESSAASNVLNTKSESSDKAPGLSIPTVKFKSIMTVVTVLVLIISIVSIKKIIDKYQKETALDSSLVEAVKTTEEPKSEAGANVETQATPGSTATAPLSQDAINSSANTVNSVVNSSSAKPAPTTQTGSVSSATQPVPAVQSTPLANPSVTTPTTQSPTGNVQTPPSKPVAKPQTTTTNALTVSSTTNVTSNNAPSQATVATKKETSVEPMPTPASANAPNTGASTTNATIKPDVKKQIELIIEALDKVDIEYTSNSGKAGKISLSTDQVHTFKGSNGLKLKISNGGAVNIILNGKEVGIPGDLGKPISLSY